MWLEIRANLKEVGVPAEEHDKCMEWALGTFYGTEACADTPDIWARLHPELPPIHLTMEVNEGIRLIGEQYLINTKVKEEKRNGA